MSSLEPLDCEGSDSLIDLSTSAFINPQYTDRRYGSMQSLCLTPEPSLTDTTPRRGSFAFSDTARSTSYFHNSSASSSFTSASACATPPLSTASSSASNSRRQSMLFSDSQLQYCLSAADSSSPSNPPPGSNSIAMSDQSSLPDYPAVPYIGTTIDPPSMMTDDMAGLISEGEYNMANDSFVNENFPSPYYDPHTVTQSLYSRTVQSVQNDDESTSRKHGPLPFTHPYFDHQPHPSILGNALPLLDMGPYGEDVHSNSNVPTLAPAFEYSERRCLRDAMANETISDIEATKYYLQMEEDAEQQLKHTIPSHPNDDPQRDRKGSKRRQQKIDIRRHPPLLKDKGHQCRRCGYACNRQEHLKRHEGSVHGKELVGGPEMLPCVFEGCIDRKTKKRREIQSRQDNLKAHYTRTHFKYGSTEKGGKNGRKSMKAALEMGLALYDRRWEFLLNRKMNVNEEMRDYLHVWKMLGYSILETRDIKVKDVVPDWQGSDDATLQEFDPRWRALWDGSLSFEKALTKGYDMEETEAQGLLGVTMLETEAMGIDHLDPRWKVLRNRNMSVEQSEKLGVKYRNPVWTDSASRRRNR